MPLPHPKVHYEVFRVSPDSPLHLFDEGLRTAMLLDPYNQTGKNPAPAHMSDYGTTYNMLRCVFAYQRSGQQVVVLGPRMQEAFTHTSLKDVPPRYIQFPHQCFYLATPDCNLRVWGGSDTGWHRIAGAYVMEDPGEKDTLSVLIWGAANEKSVTPTDDATFWLNIRLGPRDDSFLLDLDKGVERMVVDMDADIERRLDMNELRNGSLRNMEFESGLVRMDLETRLAHILDTHQANISDRGAFPISDQLVKEVKANVCSFLRIVINTLLYMNSASCETQKGKANETNRKSMADALSRKKNPKCKEARLLRRKLDETPAFHVTWIGPTIEQARDTETDLTGTHTVKGHVRRGHWHTFHVGPRKNATGEWINPQKQKATLKWLHPVWVKGGAPDDTTRIYGVKE